MARVGEVVLVRYAGQLPAIYHERLVTGLRRGSADEACILTPDLDHYPEVISLANADLDDVRWCGGFGVVPPGLTEADIYRFDEPPTAAELRRGGCRRRRGGVVAQANAESGEKLRYQRCERRR